MPAQPPAPGAPSFDLGSASQAPSADAPTPAAGGGILAPVTLARPTRDPSGGSTAYSSQGDSTGADGKPGKAEKNTSQPGMWKGIAALIANRPQRKMTVQHTISEIRGSSTDRKINHGVAEKRGSTSDTKSNRTATTAHTSKSDKSAKTANTRDAKTSAASTKADKNSRDAKTADTRSAAKKDNRDAKEANTRTSADKNSRDSKTADTRTSADKNTRDTKAASDRKDHSTRQQADKKSADNQARTAREDKNSRGADKAGRQTLERKPAPTPPAPKTPGPEATAAPGPIRKANDTKPDRKPTPEPKPTPRAEPDGVPGAPARPEPARKKDDQPRKGPYTARPARENGFTAGAQQAAVEADKAAWRDGYEDGQKAIRDKAARDKAQMDAARDRAKETPPVPPKPPAPSAEPPAKPTVPPDKPATPTTPAPPKPSGPPAQPSDAPAAESSQQNTRATRDRPQGAPRMAAKPAAPTQPSKPPAPAPVMGAVPLGAEMSTVQPGVVVLSNGRALTGGEVRTLRALTRFLQGKELETQQIADQCKQAEAVSARRVNEIQTLIEACKDPKIKAGNNLIASLQKLHEATTVQAKEAENLNRNAARGIEALRTLNQNAEVRHGGVYKAVVDSDENVPAERAFYQR
ncbi:hypothetical protein PV677_35930 [Streptomyces sp. DE06-01C]|nr:hypothetical protein [Streptomyces sp. DE06-01C]